MKRVYSRGKYMKGIRKFKECDREDRRVWEKEDFEEEIRKIRMKKEKEMKLNPEAKEFRREKLPGRYTAKLLYG